jgi:hypothetical protein
MSAEPTLQIVPAPLDRPIRGTLRDVDLMVIVDMKHSRFYKAKADGAFAFLELRPQIRDANTRYSQHLVTKWLRGELAAPGQARRFFRSAEQSTPKRGPGRPRKHERERT